MNNPINIFNELNETILRPVKYIRLSYKYQLPDRSVKSYVQEIQLGSKTSKIPISYVLYSVFKYTISPLLMAQNENVWWDTVSLTYPTLKNSKHDLIKVPLMDMRGQVSSTGENSQLGQLQVNLRFTGQPKPFNKHIYGIDLTNNPSHIDKIINEFSQIYKKEFPIEGTYTVFRLVQLQTATSKNSKSKSKEKITQKYTKPYFSMARLIK